MFSKLTDTDFNKELIYQLPLFKEFSQKIFSQILKHFYQKFFLSSTNNIYALYVHKVISL